jgi:hypothetical protein
MLPRQDRNDEGALDVAAGVEAYWMRFFASLRMTAGAPTSAAKGVFAPRLSTVAKVRLL